MHGLEDLAVVDFGSLAPGRIGYMHAEHLGQGLLFLQLARNDPDDDQRSAVLWASNRPGPLPMIDRIMAASAQRVQDLTERVEILLGYADRRQARDLKYLDDTTLPGSLVVNGPDRYLAVREKVGMGEQFKVRFVNLETGLFGPAQNWLERALAFPRWQLVYRRVDPAGGIIREPIVSFGGA